MSNYHAESAERPFRRYAIAALKLAGILLTLSVVTTIAWNLAVPELFGLAPIRGKEALGVVLLLGVIATLLGRRRRRYRRLPGELS